MFKKITNLFKGVSSADSAGYIVGKSMKARLTTDEIAEQRRSSFKTIR